MEGLNAEQLQALVQAVAQGLQAAAAGGGQAQAAPNVMARMGLKMDHFDDPDPANWIKWRYKFENYVRLMEWDPPQAKRALVALVSGNAGFVVAGAFTQDQVDAPGGPAAEPAGGWGEGYGAGNAHNRPFSLAALLDLMEAKILAGRGGQQALSEFQEAAQMVGESIQAYHGRLHSIYLRAFPEMPANLRNTDKILITRFVNGIRDKAVSLTVQQNNPMNDFNRALELVAQAEAGKLNFERENARSLGSKGTINALMAAGRKRNDVSGNLPSGLLQKLGLRTPAGTTGACHNCGKLGHLKRNCWSATNPSSREGSRTPSPPTRGGKAPMRGKRSSPKLGRGQRSPNSSRNKAVAKLLSQGRYRRLLAQLNSLSTGDGEDTVDLLASEEGADEEAPPNVETGLEELLEGLNALRGESEDQEPHDDEEESRDDEDYDQEF